MLEFRGRFVVVGCRRVLRVGSGSFFRVFVAVGRYYGRSGVFSASRYVVVGGRVAAFVELRLLYGGLSR